MALKYNKLESGETYPLSYILSGDNRIIIPDLQRDYCWGDKVTSSDISKTYAYAFVEGLINNITNDSLNLGLIYGYESPVNHIQLCDGQQRFTTLFLLIGMINRKTGNHFKSFLISDYEMNDDNEPRLQYSIRESSLYFLSDLTMHFFLSGHNLEVSDIEDQSWFFNDYKLDPSIQSMLKSLKDIKNILDNPNIDLLEIGKKIVNKLTFMYYDMRTRRTGEETFVIINTTGEPLSITENLKAMLFSKQNSEQKKIQCVDSWEIWEQFFWKKRNIDKNDTADNGMAEFFRWIMLLEHNKNRETTEFEKIQESGSYTLDLSIPIELLNEYFEIVKWLFDDKDGVFKENLIWLSPEESNHEQIGWFRLLPVIAYVKRFPLEEYLSKHADATDKDYKRSVIRVKNFFYSLSKITNIQKAIKTLLSNALTLIKNMPTDDIVSLLSIEDKISTMIMSEEVKNKLSIYEDSTHNRNEIEDAFWRAEQHNILSGEILPLLEWSTDAEKKFDFNLFKEYLRIFNELFYGEMHYEELDITRRALIAHGLDEYPRYFRGNTNCSFAYSYNDWHELIFSNISLLKTFMDKMKESKSKEKLYELQNDIINSFPHDKKYAEFVHQPELLKFCEEKNIQFWFGTWFLMKKQRWSGEHANIKAYKYFLKLSSEEEKKGWKLRFYTYDETCVYYDQNTDNKPNISIEMKWNVGEQHNLQEISLFLKHKGNVESTKSDVTRLNNIADSLSYTCINEKYFYRVEMPEDENESFDLMDDLRNKLFDKLSSEILFDDL